MPYRRRYANTGTRNRRRRYARRPRSYVRRRTGGYRRPKRYYRQTTTYKFKRMFHSDDRVDLPDVVTFAETSGGFVASLNFMLEDVPNYSEFIALYDEYRIRGVTVECIPTFTSTELNVAYSGTIAQSSIYSALDFNGGTAPTNLNALGQQNGTRHTRGNRTHRRYLRPRPLTQLYQSALSTAYTSKSSGWISCGYPSVPHYGLNFLVEQLAAAGASWAYRFTYTYYLEFRGTK